MAAKPATLTVNQFERMVARTRDHTNALEATNLATRLFLRRLGVPSFKKSSEWHVYGWWFATVVTSHIVMTHYKRDGIDILPGTVGEEYGYYLGTAVKPHSCGRWDIKEMPLLSTGSFTVSATAGQKRVYAAGKALLSGEDPFLVVERTRQKIVTGWPGKCPHSSCLHHRVGDMVCKTHQVVSLALSMGLVERALVAETAPASNLGSAWKGRIPDEYAQVLIRLNSGRGEAWVHREEGWFATSPTTVVPYERWFAGDITRALAHLATWHHTVS